MMNSVKFLSLLPIVALAFAVCAASANEHYHEKHFNADTKDKFDQVAASVREEMKAGGRYEFVTAGERRTIDEKLADMQGLFADANSVADMKQDTKVRLFNDQEVVNSILTHRDRDRVICTHQSPVGSHIPITTCHTYGQEVQANHETRNQLDEWKRGACRGAVCASGQP